MSLGEAAVLVFIIAAFVVFGIILAWEAHREEADRAARAGRSADMIGTHGPTGAQSHQGADG